MLYDIFYIYNIYIYIYYVFLLCGSKIISFPGSRILPHPGSEDQLRELKEHAVVLASARGDLSIMGLLLKLGWNLYKGEIQVKKTIEKTWRWFGVQGVGGGTVYEHVCFWDGVKLGGNLKCGRVEIFFVLAMIGWTKSDLRMPMNGASHHHLIDFHLC